MGCRGEVRLRPSLLSLPPCQEQGLQDPGGAPFWVAVCVLTISPTLSPTAQEICLTDAPAVMTLVDGPMEESDNLICVAYRHQFDVVNESTGEAFRLHHVEASRVSRQPRAGGGRCRAVASSRCCVASVPGAVLLGLCAWSCHVVGQTVQADRTAPSPSQLLHKPLPLLLPNNRPEASKGNA